MDKTVGDGGWLLDSYDCNVLEKLRWHTLLGYSWVRISFKFLVSVVKGKGMCHFERRYTLWKPLSYSLEISNSKNSS